MQQINLDLQQDKPNQNNVNEIIVSCIIPKIKENKPPILT